MNPRKILEAIDNALNILPITKKETNNEDYVEVEESTLREVIENLEKMYPGTKDYLVGETE